MKLRMKGAAMARHDKKGRTKGATHSPEARWVQLVNGFRWQPWWKALSPYARLIYIELKAKWTGADHSNNGKIMASVRHLADLVGCDKNTAARALNELEDRGFIVATQLGCIGFEGRGRGTCWRLTELPCVGQPATQDYRRLWAEKQNPVREKRTGCMNDADR